ncbi:MAG: hypothetical protein HYZ85_04595 [Candidatus Omnitrophica bacterium]|nr:hypothetical protein [Candidatus Omnitrophota bacterium]
MPATPRERALPQASRILITNENGFQLIEALIALVIISIACVSLMGVLSGSLKVTGKGEFITKGLLATEKLLYQLEISERMDLLLFGGKENKDGYLFEIITKLHQQEVSIPIEFYDTQIQLKGAGRDEWNFETVLSS